MRGLVKIVLGIVAVLLLLVVGAMAYVVFIFDPNDSKATLAEVVQKQTGRTLEIEGDLDLSFFPWLAVNVGEARLSNAAGFGDEPFLELQGASLGVRLMPILSGEIELDRVRIDGLRLNLMVDAKGRTNWDDLAGEETEEPPEPAGESAMEFEAKGIGGLLIRDATLNWDDRQAGQAAKLEGWNLETGAIEPGQPVRVETSVSGQLDDPALKFRFNALATLRMEAEGQRLNLSAPQFDLELEGDVVPGGSMPVGVRLDEIDVDLEQETLQLKALVAEALGVVVNAEIAGSGILGQPVFSGSFEVPGFSARQLMEQVEVPPPVTADADVLSHLRIKGFFKLTEKALAISDLDMMLDQTRLQGSLDITDLERQSIRFGLEVDSIDLDRYLPPESEEEEVSEASDEDVEIPVETLRSLDAQGSLSIGTVVVSGMTLSNLRVGLKAKGGNVRLQPLDLALYEGQATGRLSLDAAGATPTLSIDESLRGVQLGQLSQDLIERSLISGAANMKVALNASGKTVGSMRKSLAGDLGFDVEDGALEGVDLIFELQRARSLFRKQVPAGRTGPKRTPFEQLKATATASGGVLRNDDLAMQLAIMQVTGAGEVDVGESLIDYRLTATVFKVPEADEQLDGLQGASIPIAVKGSLDDPSITPDVAALAKKQVEEILQSEDAQEEIKKKADELKEKFKGLLGN